MAGIHARVSTTFDILFQNKYC